MNVSVSRPLCVTSTIGLLCQLVMAETVSFQGRYSVRVTGETDCPHLGIYMHVCTVCDRRSEESLRLHVHVFTAHIMTGNVLCTHAAMC